MKLRGGYHCVSKQFFVFSDHSPVSAGQARRILKLIIHRLNLKSGLYGMHSFHIGRTTDLIKYNYSIDEVKLMGRWKSNIVFKYMRDYR